MVIVNDRGRFVRGASSTLLLGAARMLA